MPLEVPADRVRRSTEADAVEVAMVMGRFLDSLGRCKLKIADFLEGDESYGYMSYMPQNVGHELNLITYID